MKVQKEEATVEMQANKEYKAKQKEEQDRKKQKVSSETITSKTSAHCCWVFLRSMRLLRTTIHGDSHLLVFPR